MVLKISGDSGPQWDALLRLGGELDESLTLDLSPLRWASPLLATRLRISIDAALSGKQAVTVVAPEDPNVSNYLSRIHLLDGLQPDQLVNFRPITEHDRRDSVLPLTRMSSQADVEQAMFDLVPVLEALVGNQAAALEPIEQAIAEFANNSIEHGGAPSGCLVAAQRMPSARRLELAISDAGIGIPNHVRRVETAPASDKDAIAFAMQVGISGTSRSDRGMGFEWITGSISEATNHSGSIEVISGSGRVTRSIEPHEIRETISATPPIVGTSVVIRLSEQS